MSNDKESIEDWKNIISYIMVYRGVLSVSWSNDDPDLLISCGKDNKLLVWNPNTEAQVVDHFVTSRFRYDIL
jgi:WD40 repeat protein